MSDIFNFVYDILISISRLTGFSHKEVITIEKINHSLKTSQPDVSKRN